MTTSYGKKCLFLICISTIKMTNKIKKEERGHCSFKHYLNMRMDSIPMTLKFFFFLHRRENLFLKALIVLAIIGAISVGGKKGRNLETPLTLTWLYKWSLKWWKHHIISLIFSLLTFDLWLVSRTMASTAAWSMRMRWLRRTAVGRLAIITRLTVGAMWHWWSDSEI